MKGYMNELEYKFYRFSKQLPCKILRSIVKVLYYMKKPLEWISKGYSKVILTPVFRIDDFLFPPVKTGNALKDLMRPKGFRFHKIFIRPYWWFNGWIKEPIDGFVFSLSNVAQYGKFSQSLVYWDDPQPHIEYMDYVANQYAEYAIDNHHVLEPKAEVAANRIIEIYKNKTFTEKERMEAWSLYHDYCTSWET